MNINMNRTAAQAENAELATRHLQETLSELIDIGLQAKQAHWNVVGPRFRSVHLQLDDLVTHTRAFADTIAERVVTLGEPAEGNPAAVAKQSKLEPMPGGYLPDDKVVACLVERLASLCERLRDRIPMLRDRDPVGEDLLIQALARLEEQMWMFHAQTQGA